VTKNNIAGKVCVVEGWKTNNNKNPQKHFSVLSDHHTDLSWLRFSKTKHWRCYNL